jgi:TetR/AcrR family transcriptional regulator, lmrAB and yxaGH operons repressor
VNDTSARARILAAAQDLFQRRGFHAVGLNDILAAAKAPKGSLYHHFPAGKDELGARAVQGIAADVHAYIAARRAEGAVAADIVGDLAEMSARRMERECFGWSPLIAAVAHQTGADSPLLGQALANAYGDWRAELGAAFETEGFAPDTAQSLARTAIALLEGAVILTRIDQEAAPLRAVRGQAARLAALERNAPAPRPEESALSKG